MAITQNQLQKNLRNARRPDAVYIDPKRAEAIRKGVRDGLSKKAICLVYSIDYQQLKEICRV